MTFLTQYATGIIIASAAKLLCDMLMPEGSIKKYVQTVTGLIVTLIIVSPIAKLPFYAETFEMPALDLPGVTAQEAQHLSSNALKTQFESDLANQVSARLLEHFHAECDAAVEVGLDEEGLADELLAVRIFCPPTLNAGEVKRFAASLLGIETSRIEVFVSGD